MIDTVVDKVEQGILQSIENTPVHLYLPALNYEINHLSHLPGIFSDKPGKLHQKCRNRLKNRIMNQFGNPRCACFERCTIAFCRANMGRECVLEIHYELMVELYGLHYTLEGQDKVMGENSLISIMSIFTYPVKVG